VISREEIEAKSAEFDIHTSNVQRDYVFGWLLSGLFTSALGERLVLKGGNAFRKAYLPEARFSDDLDFTTQEGIDSSELIEQLNMVCGFAEERSGIRFEYDRNQVVSAQLVGNRTVYKVRLYFNDFFGVASQLTLKVRLDITEYDRIYLPVQTPKIIHQFSDSAECEREMRCIKLEEALANKLKCLLQRRYAQDLFDLAYGIFVSKTPSVDRREVVSTFLRKSIFEPSPVAARDLLVNLPFDLMRGFWDRIVCPPASRLSFDGVLRAVRDGIRVLFEPFSYGEHLRLAYFPAEIRNPILDAASGLHLIRLTYDGLPRIVEPYSLVFKRRKTDGVAQEYFYAHDRTGGRRSGPGIKAFMQGGIGSIEVMEEVFEPRFEVELSKAGERYSEMSAAKPFIGRRRTHW